MGSKKVRLKKVTKQAFRDDASFIFLGPYGFLTYPEIYMEF